MAELGKLTGLSESLTSRVVRLAVCDRIFHEDEDGLVGHTPVSALLAQDTNLRDWLDVTFHEVSSAKLKTAEVLATSDVSLKAEDSGFSKSNNESNSFFSYLQKNPERAKKFSNGMRAANSRTGFGMSHLSTRLASMLNSTDIPADSSIASGKVKVWVDIGGSSGEAMMSLIPLSPDTTCIVQDLPSTVADLPTISTELQDRMKFMACSFFEPQPVRGADVYLLRNILHNWPDDDCVKIIRNIVPAMTGGGHSKIVINDWCLNNNSGRPRGTYRERKMRVMDMNMLSLFNAGERDEGDWADLIGRADERLRVTGYEHPEHENYSIITVVLGDTSPNNGREQVLQVETEGI